MTHVLCLCVRGGLLHWCRPSQLPPPPLRVKGPKALGRSPSVDIDMLIGRMSPSLVVSPGVGTPFSMPTVAEAGGSSSGGGGSGSGAAMPAVGSNHRLVAARKTARPSSLSDDRVSKKAVHGDEDHDGGLLSPGLLSPPLFTPTDQPLMYKWFRW